MSVFKMSSSGYPQKKNKKKSQVDVPSNTKGISPIMPTMLQQSQPSCSIDNPDRQPTQLSGSLVLWERVQAAWQRRA
jgi:hypothetical protein